jgi:hypothetical protein
MVFMAFVSPSGVTVNPQRLSAISAVWPSPKAGVRTENLAMPGHTRLRMETSAFCLMNPLQQADDLFQGLGAEQLVPVKVAVELQQEQILLRLIAAS